MPFGRSDAGLEWLSDFRASVVQGMRTLWRAHDVVSTIACWRSHPSDGDGEFGVKQGEFFAEQLLQPAHEPYRIPVPSRAAVVLPSPSGFSPSYRKPWYLSWRKVIVAGRSRKSSASLDADEAERERSHQRDRTCCQRHNPDHRVAHPNLPHAAIRARDPAEPVSPGLRETFRTAFRRTGFDCDSNAVL